MAVRLPPSFAEKAMSIFARFFGKSDADDSGAGQLVANPKIEHPLSLQVLFSGPCVLDSDRLAEAFRSYHRSMARVRCEMDPALIGPDEINR